MKGLLNLLVKSGILFALHPAFNFIEPNARAAVPLSSANAFVIYPFPTHEYPIIHREKALSIIGNDSRGVIRFGIVSLETLNGAVRRYGARGLCGSVMDLTRWCKKIVWGCDGLDMLHHQ